MSRLLLYKAARTTAHLRENLDLLAAPDGAVVESAYAERWFAASLRGDPPQDGDDALVVLALYPYDILVPCRVATVARAASERGFLQLRLTLGDFLGEASQRTAGARLARLPRNDRPRETFVATAPDDLEIELAGSPDDAEHAWRAVTARLRGSADYAQVVFGRLAELAEPLRLAEPAELRILLDAPAAAEPRLHAEIVSGAAHLGRARLDRGHGTLEVTPELPEPLALRIGVAAPGYVTTWLTVERLIESAAAQEPAEAIAPTPAAEPEHPLAALVAPPDVAPLRRDDLRRLLRDAPRLERDQLARRLGELAAAAAPDDPEIASRTAALLLAVERYEEAAALLGRFDPAELGERALYDRFQADCRAGRIADAELLLERLDFATDEEFALLREAVDHLPDAVAVRLGRRLLDDVLADDRGVALFRHLEPRIATPDDAYAFAERVMYARPDEAAEFLVDRTRDGPPHEKLLELLVDIARETPGQQRIGPQLVALAALRVERGDADGAVALTQVAESEARLAERAELARVVAPALVAAGRRVDAVELLCRTAEAALAGGEPRSAAELALHAVSVAAGDEDAAAIASELATRSEQAIRATEPLRDLLERDHDERVRRTRALIGGRVLMLVGGKRDESCARQLRERFGFSEVRWLESEREKHPDIGPIDQVDAAKTVVVTITDRIGHSTSVPLKERCRTRGIAHLEVRGGIRSLTDAILDHDWRSGR